MTTKEGADYPRKFALVGKAHQRALVRLLVKQLKKLQAKMNERAA